jgi:hypothetical protein
MPSDMNWESNGFGMTPGKYGYSDDPRLRCCGALDAHEICWGPFHPAASAFVFDSAVVSSLAVLTRFLVASGSQSVRIATFRFVGTTLIVVEALVLFESAQVGVEK